MRDKGAREREGGSEGREGRRKVGGMRKKERLLQELLGGVAARRVAMLERKGY